MRIWKAILKNGMQHHLRTTHINRGGSSLNRLYLHWIRLGIIIQGMCSSSIWRCLTTGNINKGIHTINSGLCTSARWHWYRKMIDTIRQVMGVLSNLHLPTAGGIRQTTLVMKCNIDQGLRASLRQCRTWTIYIYCDLCISLIGNRYGTSRITLGHSWTNCISRVLCISLRRYRPMEDIIICF